MERNQFGPFGKVSRLTLGGGGIGQVWGETSREEAIATIRMAVDNGIDVLDAAPGYHICEELIGETFGGKLPEGLKITTKHGIGDAPVDEVYTRCRASLEKSLKDMRIERVDLFFVHNALRADDAVAPEGHDHFTRWAVYREAVIPAFERLMAEGLIGGWGLTGVAAAQTIIDALNTAPKPHAVQAVANLLDSPGGLAEIDQSPRHREIIATAQANGVGVMGIRAVQAGALTRGFDRPMPDGLVDVNDYDHAAPFRALCAKWGEDPAVIAHRYALGMDGVDTVVLGVKNRAELQQTLDAEAAGPLEVEQLAAIEKLGLRPDAREWVAG